MPKIPRFRSEKEEADFWSTHSAADYWEELEGVEEPIEPSHELKAEVLKRIDNKRLLTLRVDPSQIEEARQIAKRKTIGYQTLMRIWIAEGIEREKRSA